MHLRLLRHTLRVVFWSSLVVGVAGCATRGMDKMEIFGHAGPDVCSGNQTPSPYAPIVCVDDRVSNLPATPDTVHAVNLPAGRRPTLVNWFTVTGTHNLSISFIDSGCAMRDPDCNGPHCVAVIKPNAAVGTSCRYKIAINMKGYESDPIVQIDACCPSP